MTTVLKKNFRWIVLLAGGASALALWSEVPGQLAPTLVSGMFILVLAYAWNIVGGILGELSLSTMVFWALGAYGLVLAGNSDQDIRLAVALAVVAAGAFGWALVAVAGWLGLKGLYLAVFTLIVYEVARSIVVGLPVLGANEGLIYKELTSADTAAYALIVLAVLVIAANVGVLGGRLGKRWLSIKDDIVAAEAVGVFSAREKGRAYALSAGLATLGGAVQAYYIGFAQPETALSLDLLIMAILAVYIGGPGTASGPFLGVVLVYGLSAVATNLSTSINVALYAQLLQYALAFVIILVLSAGQVSRVGLISGLAALFRRFQPARPALRPQSRLEPADDVTSLPSRRPGAEPGELVLEVRAVSKRFGANQVLREVSMDLRAGEIVGLMGPNGAGKTTLCNVITGVVGPDQGSIWLEGCDITRRSTPQRFHDGIARTFQAARLFPSLSIYDNVAMAASGGGERVPDLLERYGLTGAGTAVGAPTFIRRLTEVARALATDKRVLILDEPLAGLTPAQHKLILDSLQAVAATGTSVVLIEHLIQAVAPVCDRLVVMADGAVIADGTPPEVLRDERVVDVYLGTAAAAGGVPDVAQR